MLTERQIADNDKYTMECSKIYKSFQIAEVRITDVLEATIPMFILIAPTLLLLIAFIVATIQVKCYGALNGDMSRVYIILYLLIAVFLIAVIVLSIYISKTHVRKRDLATHQFLYRDSTGFYSLYTREGDCGFEVITITNLDNLMNLNVTAEGAEIYSSKKYCPWQKYEQISGIKQFTVAPNHVFSNTDQSLIVRKHKLKQKKVYHNTIIYKFYNKQGLVIGARHPHCLVIKDGKIQYAVAHYMRKHSYQGYNHSNYKHTYSRINDETIKLVLTLKITKKAKKAKFNLPLPSINIIYEEDNQANDT
jgi:hypothetical protein